MNEFYPTVPNVSYEGARTDNPMAYRFYNPDEIIAGKTMRDHLKFAMAYWHTMCADGTDMFGRGTFCKNYGASDPMELARRKVYAAMELMDKLQLDYFCFHDADIAPEADTLSETNRRLDEISDLLAEQMKAHKKKLLWGTANCFNHPRFMHGAGTAPNADVFAFAAAKIKKAIELTVKLGGNGYVFWGGREGYETLLNTDMAQELDHMAYLLAITTEYGRRIGFKGDYYIEPKPKEPTKHQYDFDAATVLGFLRAYGLEKSFKLNIEANHATLAGHTFQHELRVARVNDAFGSIDANQGDLLLGWDTDQFPTNVYDTTLCMLEVLEAGGFTNGGLNFDAKTRRGSNTPEDLALSFIAGMDCFALGLRMAQKIREDGRLAQFVRDRYSSYDSGIGKRIAAKQATIEELERHAITLGEVTTNTSGKQEYLENLLNSVLFAG